LDDAGFLPAGYRLDETDVEDRSREERRSA
jgi:hypothetical protein